MGSESAESDEGLLSDDAFAGRGSPLPLAARIAAHTGGGIAHTTADDGAAVSRSQPVRRKGKGKGRPRTLRLDDEGRSRSQPNPATPAGTTAADAGTASGGVAVAEAAAAAADGAIPKRALFYGCCRVRYTRAHRAPASAALVVLSSR